MKAGEDDMLSFLTSNQEKWRRSWWNGQT